MNQDHDLASDIMVSGTKMCDEITLVDLTVHENGVAWELR